MKTLVDDAGRIQLPDLVQAQLGVKPGDELDWEEEDGRWFLGPASSRPVRPEPSVRSRATPNAAPPREQRSAANSAGETDHDDLNWEDLDYEPLSLPRAGQVRLRVLRRGKLQPLPHDLDEE
jgi:bifunctional DNA-binding transcriptional regulator/antitoxin component of YhaV-PrlF toxin-antitoxin module